VVLKYKKILGENNIIPSFTAVAPGSSIATYPRTSKLQRQWAFSATIAGYSHPLGGTCQGRLKISSILKMAVVFSMFGKSFNSPSYLAALA